MSKETVEWLEIQLEYSRNYVNAVAQGNTHQAERVERDWQHWLDSLKKPQIIMSGVIPNE